MHVQVQICKERKNVTRKRKYRIIKKNMRRRIFTYIQTYIQRNKQNDKNRLIKDNRQTDKDKADRWTNR